MQLFKLKTRLSQFDNFADFAKEFELGANDLVVTNEFIYEPFMKALNLPCTFIFQEKYGLGEPSDEMMNAILNDVKSVKFNRIIAVGGGTIIDICKLFTLKGVENVTDAFLRKIPIVKEKQLVILPTTCGTGSEVTNISIAELKSLHTKMGLADDAIVADDAVLVPELLKGLPFKFYACSAIDALVHATESFVAPKSNPYTEALGKEAMRIIIEVFKGIAEKGQDYRFENFGPMLMASNFAGIAFGNTGVGAVHALSYPLGGNYHVPHGEANYQFYTAIFHLYNKKNPNGKIKELTAYLQQLLGCTGDPYDALDELLGKLIKKNQLRTYGMKEEEIAGFAKAVLETQQRLLNNNYVPLSEEEIRQVYADLY